MKYIHFISSKRFQRQAGKEYLKKIRWYPPCLYHLLDKWLCQMSTAGWHIVDCTLFSFLFEKGKPEDRRYFTYSIDMPRADAGKYSIPMRYPMLEKTYGVHPKKSKINANKQKVYKIVELNREAIDTKYKISYCEMLNDRNRLYKMRAVRNLLLCIIAIIALGLFWTFYANQ